MSEKPITSRDACALLGIYLKADGQPISMRTLHRYKKQGLPFTDIGRSVFFDCEVRSWVNSKKRGMHL